MLAAIWAASMGLAQQPFDLDPGFRTNILTSGVFNSQYVNSILPLPDGKVLVSGQIVFSGDDPFVLRSGARLNQDGTRDGTFPDLVFMGGKITPWNNQFYCGGGQSVGRSNMDGSHDPTFDMNSSWPLVSIFQGGDYHVFPDGRVLVTGSHDMYDTLRGFVGPHQLVWFQSNGYLDTTRVHRQCNGILWTLKEQPDGKFLIGSWCSWYDGHPVGPVFRIHPDGSLDTTFTAPMEHASYTFTYDMYNYEDGRILVSGTYTSIPGVTDTVCVVRLHSDGGLDMSFHMASFRDTTTANRTPRVMETLPLEDGRLIVVGDFDFVDGISRRGIVMLHADGTVDESVFDEAGCSPFYFGSQGENLNRVIAGITPAHDGGYYIYGGYVGYSDGTTNDPTQRFVSRLYGLDVGVREHAQPRMEVYPNPSSTYVTVELEQMPAQGVLLLRDALGREVWQQRVAGYQNTVPLHGLGGGVYLLELWAGGERRAAQRVVVQ
jgi:uncharacterized delta-60 repeat protein